MDHSPSQPREPLKLPLALLGLCLATTSLWWWVAFPPVTDTPPAWLSSLQSICLGTLPDGSPAAYGWGLLFTTPLGMFSVLWVGWGKEIWPALRRMGSLATGKAALGLVVVALAGQAVWVTWRLADFGAPEPLAMLSATEPMPEAYPRGTRSAPVFSLVDARGQLLSLEHWRGEVVLMTFVFGECTTVCPLLAARLSETLATESQRATPLPNLKGVVITLDPWRDTPGALAGLTRKWNLPPAATLLSGTVREVTRVLDAYQVVRRRDGKTGEIDHVPLVYVIDPEGRLAYTLLNPTPAWMAEAAHRAARGA